MKKKILQRCILGGPLGIAIGFLITVFISLSVEDGRYYPVVPELALRFNREIDAVLVQTLCCMIYGGVFAGASVIWEMEGWSLTRMTLTHLAVISLTALPIAWWMQWMEHSLRGAGIYFSFFFGVYAVIWLSLYSTMKRRIRQWNAQIMDKASDG